MSGALVTGAGRGLGREVARALAGRGLAVHATDVDERAAIETAELIGRGAFGSKLDVRDPEQCRAAGAMTAERAGSLDVWVNNAGVLVTGYVWEHDAETRRALFEVNAMGTINGTLAALDHMRASGRGHVINVVSLAGLATPPGEALYAASKHAAISFSLGTLADLRRAGERGIHVSAFCPDGIWTPMIADKLSDPHAAPSFSGQLLRPADVAPKVVDLLDRPRPVATMPRWRGAFVRLFDAFPGVGMRMVPWLIRDAERRQARWRKRVEAGESP